MKERVVFFVILGLIASLLALRFVSLRFKEPALVQKETGEEILLPLQIHDLTFMVEIADTQDERALGLSNHTKLEPRQGMLFIFEVPGNYPFWMKDMDFPIDILWIDKKKKVVHLVEFLTPDSFPTAYTSTEDALYVLELPVGTVRREGIIRGDKVDFDVRR